MAAVEAPDVPAKGPGLSAGFEGGDWGGPVPRAVSRRFYARPSPVVARELLGRLLVRRLDGELLVARIVESEAYQQDDPASHSFAGRTARNEVMFGPAGFLYVYFTYGMHFCMNAVTGRPGEGSAVLLRAAEPLAGLGSMAVRRGTSAPRLLCSGPARLAQAFGVARPLNGADLVGGGELWVSAGHRVTDDRVGIGPRVGVRRAPDVPWRFWVEDSRFVSRARPAS
jgi:DNA-3-methyladenine glycosylase